MLATKWKTVALQEGADSNVCLKIALMHAIAVDAFGTGVVVLSYYFQSISISCLYAYSINSGVYRAIQ